MNHEMLSALTRITRQALSDSPKLPTFDESDTGMPSLCRVVVQELLNEGRLDLLDAMEDADLLDVVAKVKAERRSLVTFVEGPGPRRRKPAMVG